MTTRIARNTKLMTHKKIVEASASMVVPRLTGELTSEEMIAQRAKHYPPTTIDIHHVTSD